MRQLVLCAAAVVFAACGHGSDSKSSEPEPTTPKTTPSTVPAPASIDAAVAVAPPPVVDAATVADADAENPPGHDFTQMGKTLEAVGACGDGPVPPEFSADLIAAHCATIDKTQAQYKKSWLDIATPFFASHVPATVPKKVVYPFAGGDLSTALTVYPDADEITTMSLEPAGDPRTLGQLKGGELDRALKQVEYELKFLYRVNFSNTINMIDAMREGALPTQLIFGLSALKIHGYEVVALRYFKIEPDGKLHYLDDSEVAAAPVKAKANVRNRIFANVEI